MGGWAATLAHVPCSRGPVRGEGVGVSGCARAGASRRAYPYLAGRVRRRAPRLPKLHIQVRVALLRRHGHRHLTRDVYVHGTRMRQCIWDNAKCQRGSGWFFVRPSRRTCLALPSGSLNVYMAPYPLSTVPVAACPATSCVTPQQQRLLRNNNKGCLRTSTRCTSKRAYLPRGRKGHAGEAGWRAWRLNVWGVSKRAYLPRPAEELRRELEAGGPLCVPHHRQIEDTAGAVKDRQRGRMRCVGGVRA